MVLSITKDTVVCMSLAGRPSNIGTRFHNFLYAELELDFVYKAFTTTDLAAAIAGIRALGIRGCGVSMPYKEACIRHVDAMDDSAEAIGSVNTIVNTDGQLRAYNTDYLAIVKLLGDRQIPVDHTFAVLGSGGMAKAVVAALRDAGFSAGAVVARNARTEAALADQYGYTWRAEVGSSRPQLLVNATPVGMSGGPAAEDLPVAPEVVDAAETIMDVVALPALTPLVRRARAQGRQVITGSEVIALQAVGAVRPLHRRPPLRRPGPARRRVLPPITQQRELPAGRLLHLAISGPPGREVRGDGADHRGSKLAVSPTVGGLAGDTAAPPRRIWMTEESSCRPSPARRPAR
jgi:shikimate dehydrogenase